MAHITLRDSLPQVDILELSLPPFISGAGRLSIMTCG